MKDILIISFVLLLIGCGPKTIPYTQNTDTVEPNEAARAHYDWGLEYAKAGHLHDALTEFRLAIKIEPLWATPYYNIGSIYGNMGELDHAIKAWERATQLDSDFAKAYYNLAVAYAVKAENALGSDLKKAFIEKSVLSLRQAIRVDKTALTAAQMEEAFDGIRDLPEFDDIINTEQE